MPKQLFYPEYAGFIILYAIIFVTIGVTIAREFDRLFPKFDKTKPEAKSKLVYYAEVLAQISAMVILIYGLREITNHIILSMNVLSKNIYGSPDKYASAIISSTMFTVQPNLVYKIRYIWNL